MRGAELVAQEGTRPNDLGHSSRRNGAFSLSEVIYFAEG
jgi:hypothetical protein